MNIQLKVAILKNRLSQRDLARQTGIHESIISMAVHGKYNLDQDQRARIARVIGEPEELIFNETNN